MANEYYFILLIAGLLITLSLIASKLFAKFGVSSLLVTLMIGILMGNGKGFDFDFYYPKEALRIGELALCIIIFSGGFETNWKRIRPFLKPAIALSTIGLICTALVVCIGVHFFLQWSWMESLLLGAIISSTDAAAVFSVLEHTGLKLKEGVSEILELESGTNDPVAWFLTFGVTEYLIHSNTEVSFIALSFVQSVVIGGLSGYLFGKLTHKLITGLKLKRGQNPVMLIALILVLYSLNSLTGGSAFLAVYMAGIVLGNSAWVNRDTNIHFFEGASWLMEITLFLVLGLQVYSYELPSVIESGLIVSGLLMLVARPFGVFVSLLITGQVNHQKGMFLSWVGLRGATPIVFALIPVVKGLPIAHEIFNITFIVVLASIIFQSTTVGLAAKKTLQLLK
jgi:cell volume regulation protein A